MKSSDLNQLLNINIAGRNYHIKSTPENAPLLEEAAFLLNSTMDEVLTGNHTITDREKLIVMSALKILVELLSNKGSGKYATMSEADSRLEKLEHQLTDLYTQLTHAAS